ncbi:ferritin-like domain-containing protein [Pectobacteriaceae bacterium C52]|nr:ferritin-like domain-containing protein [Pectobacteriaceae bacterium C52]
MTADDLSQPELRPLKSNQDGIITMNLHEQTAQKQSEVMFREYGYVKLTSHKDLAQELADIRTLLQKAMVLEHATIPPYLTMLYSLDEHIDNRVPDVIRSVVIEEMLHFVLVANILNAIGGTPTVNSPDFLPDYPAPLPYGIDDIEIQLHAFSQHAIAQAMQIEHPKHIRPEVIASHVCSDMTIGEFYIYIASRLRAAVATFGESAVFCGDPQRQICPEQFQYNQGSRVITVLNLENAVKAIRLISHQGEGTAHSIWRSEDNELAHYFRFNEIHCERRYTLDDTIASGPTGEPLEIPWHSAVKTHSGAKVSDYPEGEARKAIIRFNRHYCELLENLQTGLTGKPQKLMPAVIAMCSLRDDFRAITANPYPGDSEYHCAPTFEYTPNKTSKPVKSQSLVFANNQVTLEKLQHAYSTGNLQMAMACMAENIIWDISGPLDVPYAGVFYGHEGFSRFWSLMEQTVEFSSVGIDKMFFSDNQAMTYGGEQGITKSTRVPYSYDWAIRYEFNDDHKVTLMRQYFNPMRIQAALAAPHASTLPADLPHPTS